MKSSTRLILIISFFIGFESARLQAQESSQPNLLMGEWSMKEKDKPLINDTITLTKESLNKHAYERWIFKEAKNMQIVYYKDYNKSGVPQIAISPDEPREWSFDDSVKILKIHYRSADQYFKIWLIDDISIMLVRTK
jgi:hypothetical protein